MNSWLVLEVYLVEVLYACQIYSLGGVAVKWQVKGI
jgi:hypothetical protein